MANRIAKLGGNEIKLGDEAKSEDWNDSFEKLLRSSGVSNFIKKEENFTPTSGGRYDVKGEIIITLDSELLEEGEVLYFLLSDNKEKIFSTKNDEIIFHNGVQGNEIKKNEAGTIIKIVRYNNSYESFEIPSSLLETLSEAGSDVYSVSFSPDNSLIAYGSSDTNVYVHSVDDWSLLETLSEASDDVWSVSFSPDSSLIAYGSNDNNVYVHSVDDWSLLETLSEASDRVYSVSFSPDNSLIAYGSNDNNVYIHSVLTDIESDFFV